MNRIFIVILCTFATIDNVISQQINLDDFPTKDVEKRAKLETKSNIDSLSTILELNKKESKVRQFELSFCDFFPIVSKGKKNLTPVGEFPTVQGCPGFYYYIFRSNRKTSFYYITFFYDKSGKIVEKEIVYMLVIP